VRVRVRTTAAGPWGVLLAGTTGIVPDATGRAMVLAGSAEEAGIEEVASAPVQGPVATATAEPTEAAVVDAPRRRRKRAQVQELPA
jgi:hypothetical protein